MYTNNAFNVKLFKHIKLSEVLILNKNAKILEDFLKDFIKLFFMV